MMAQLTYGIKMPERIWDHLLDAARENNTSLSEVVEDICRKHLFEDVI
jgi:hypothetical protein